MGALSLAKAAWNDWIVSGGEWTRIYIPSARCLVREGHSRYQARPLANSFREITMSEEKDDWHYCHECQIERGGEVPKYWEDGKMIVTMTKGKCSKCGEENFLVPNVDYDWPEKGEKAIWD